MEPNAYSQNAGFRKKNLRICVRSLKANVIEKFSQNKDAQTMKQQYFTKHIIIEPLTY